MIPSSADPHASGPADRAAARPSATARTEPEEPAPVQPAQVTGEPAEQVGSPPRRRGQSDGKREGSESESDRWQRNFADLLQELRVAQTGVQILFAFLLTLPFSARFEDTSEFQRDIYVVALLAAAAATAMIISPVAFHRALFRQGRKPELVRFAHRMATGGLAFMLISMVSSVLLITDFILSRNIAFLLTACTGLFFLTFWAALPFARRNWGDDDDDE